MAIDEVEATQRFGRRDEFGNRPTMTTIKARAEREMSMAAKQEAGETRPMKQET